ncbi:MAG: hypothetical protein IIB53_16725, partial [Planctomycetes bacterium]|nr:hypothetical protein [Planctomycetota bacterium]
ANGSSLLDRNHGGGMLIEGEPSVVRCTITSNTASTRAGRGDDEKKLPKSRKIPEKPAYIGVEGLE